MTAQPGILNRNSWTMEDQDSASTLDDRKARIENKIGKKFGRKKLTLYPRTSQLTEISEQPNISAGQDRSLL